MKIDHEITPLETLVIQGPDSEMTGDDLYSIIKYLVLTQVEFGKKLGTIDPNAARTRESINEHTRGVRPVPKIVAKCARKLLMNQFIPAYDAFRRKHESSVF